MRRDQNDGRGTANDQSFGEFRHRFDGMTHVGYRLATHLWHHNRRMWRNAGKNQATALVAHRARFRSLKGTADILALTAEGHN